MSNLDRQALEAMADFALKAFRKSTKDYDEYSRELEEKLKPQDGSKTPMPTHIRSMIDVVNEKQKILKDIKDLNLNCLAAEQTALQASLVYTQAVALLENTNG